MDQPFTRWSLRKFSAYLIHNHGTRHVVVGRERLRQFVHKHDITFQRAKTWKESNDPDRDTKLARIEHVSSNFPDRVFAFDEFGPLTIRPHLGAGWTKKGHPDRLPANNHKLCGVRQFHGCYSMGGDTRALQAYLRWRNANARHPDVLAAQRRERARVRSERHHRWGQRATHAA